MVTAPSTDQLTRSQYFYLRAVAKQLELKDVGDEIAAIQQRMQGEAASAARKIADTALA